ncbi:MAG: monomethylamine:corrinoid methyltransferase, partial [Thermoplasmata archaeon]
GPCTPMVLFETSASVTAAVTSGLSIESLGVASNRYEDRTTPVEPRISAEVGHAVAGMKLQDANTLAKKLLGKYESKLLKPPLGKTLHECWDAEKRRPTKEYSSVIRAYKRSMRDLGVDLRDEA